ncbi:hypothetical protein ACFWGI_17015 [Streptomyces niveus]
MKKTETAEHGGQDNEKRLSVRQVLIDWLPVAAIIVEWMLQHR